MQLYLATPMTGIPKMNLPACQTAKSVLESLGHTVYLPHDIGVPSHDGPCYGPDDYPGVTGQRHNGYCYLKADLVFMLRYCDGIVMMPGWDDSRGAMIEWQTAKAVQMPVFYYINSEDPMHSEDGFLVDRETGVVYDAGL